MGLFSLLPIDSLPSDNIPLELPEDQKQLRVDAVNVLEGRVDINTFAPDYQNKIKWFYRFYGTRYNSKYPVVAKRTSDTLDIV